jgi:hypothetical protein
MSSMVLFQQQLKCAVVLQSAEDTQSLCDLACGQTQVSLAGILFERQAPAVSAKKRPNPLDEEPGACFGKPAELPAGFKLSCD